MLDGYFVKKVGANRGSPRVWLEGLEAAVAGFHPGQRYDIEVRGKTLVLQVNPDGSRVVSGKTIGERVNPVIDLNSRTLLAVFDGMAAVRVVAREGEIYILPLASELKKQERMQRLREKLETGAPLSMGSLSHGGGVMSHALHAGLQRAGVPAELVFANEIRDDLIQQASAHNDAWTDRTVPLVAPMQELAFDEKAMAHLPKVDVLEAGLPCSGLSKAGKTRRGLKHEAEHPEVGHLVVGALVIISKANPAVVIVENVPTAAVSETASILRNQLRDMGYDIHERVLSGREWGAFEHRDRWCMVAVTEGLEIDLDELLPPETHPRKLGEILENVPADDPRFKEYRYLKDKLERDQAEGKGFAFKVVTPESPGTGVINKLYWKGQSTGTYVASPDDPEKMRLLTPREHASVKGVPHQLIDGLSNTIAHEMLGQGVLYEPFQDLGHHVGNSLQRLVGRAGVALENRADLSAAAGELQVPVEAVEVAAEVVSSLSRANPEKGRYKGQVVAACGDFVVQDVGRGAGVVHDRKAFAAPPKLGATVRVSYDRGRGRAEGVPVPQMSLGLE